jgi:hypothetical protein
MRAQVNCPYHFEYSISNKRNCVLVENQEAGVVIRAARDDISSREKVFLVRHLADEGFIPKRYRWFAGSESELSSGLKWIVDSSWLKEKAAPNKNALSRILKLTYCAFLAWLAMMAFALLQAPHRPASTHRLPPVSHSLETGSQNSDHR